MATPNSLNPRLARYLLVAALLPLCFIAIVVARVGAQKAVPPAPFVQQATEAVIKPEVNRLESPEKAVGTVTGKPVVEHTQTAKAAQDEADKKRLEDKKAAEAEDRQQNTDTILRLTKQRWTEAAMNTLTDDDKKEYDIGNNKKITVPDLLDKTLSNMVDENGMKKLNLIRWYNNNKSSSISILLDYLKNNSLLQYLPDDIKELLNNDNWRAKGAELKKAFNDAGYL